MKNRTSTVAVAALAAALTALAAVPAAASTTEQTIVRAESPAARTASPKALVTYVYDQLFNQKNTAVIDRYISPDFIQHNPTVANGSEAVRSLVQSIKASTPDSHSTIEHVVAQGDLVILQSHVVPVPGSRGLDIVDMFRVEDGKLVEHWDTIQSVPAQTVSGNDLFSDLTGHGTPAASAAATRRNTNLVRSYLESLTVDRNVTAVDRYVSPTLRQHQPDLADGAEATEEAYTELFSAHPDFRATITQVVAEGDLVAVHSHYQNSPDDRGQSVYDIFRVQHGKIVEHWSSAQNVPATSVNGNSMF
ncbi:nuclear transport factor 2 family protein [Streptomyces sp. NPDC091972]|uniref:nuclear transport factor 2 family protein n=1 Tax=Streptomyces sp. NPDC091972 TaxID=3366007 RepID=UPI00382506DC